jgi:hypothetical protein
MRKAFIQRDGQEPELLSVVFSCFRMEVLKVVTGLCSFLSENTEGSCVATDIAIAPGLIFSFSKKQHNLSLQLLGRHLR